MRERTGILRYFILWEVLLCIVFSRCQDRIRGLTGLLFWSYICPYYLTYFVECQTFQLHSVSQSWNFHNGFDPHYAPPKVISLYSPVSLQSLNYLAPTLDVNVLFHVLTKPTWFSNEEVFSLGDDIVVKSYLFRVTTQCTCVVPLLIGIAWISVYIK